MSSSTLRKSREEQGRAPLQVTTTQQAANREPSPTTTTRQTDTGHTVCDKGTLPHNLSSNGPRMLRTWAMPTGFPSRSPGPHVTLRVGEVLLQRGHPAEKKGRLGGKPRALLTTELCCLAPGEREKEKENKGGEGRPKGLNKEWHLLSHTPILNNPVSLTVKLTQSSQTWGPSIT